MEINYSVIIPHKNIPNLLKRCLDSIPKQRDVEIIIVDDNSDSSIVDFSHFPGKDRDDVTIIYDKSNNGPGNARNIGLEIAKGKWIIFIDADDFFNYCYKDILTDYKNDNSDIVYFSASSVDSDTYINSTRADDFITLINNYFENKAEGETKLRYLLASPWGKLIKRKLIIENNIYFPNYLICEDVKFSYLIGWYSNIINVDKRALCCYTSQNISRSSIPSEEVFLDKIRVYAERDKFLIDHNIPLPYGSFYIDSLYDLKKNKNSSLYLKTISILEDYSIPQNIINSLLDEKTRHDKYIIKTFFSIKRRIKYFFSILN